MSHFKLRLLFILLIPICVYACHNSNGKLSGTHVNKRPKITNKNSAAIAPFPLVDSLKSLFAVADTIRHFYGDNDTIDHVEAINEAISTTLKKILSDTAITHHNIAHILSIDELGIVSSDDERLWLFTWYENTGGSFKSNRSIAYCLDNMGRPVFDDGNFTSGGAAFDAIYKLRSDKKDLYLCIGSGRGCNTCVFYTATVVELKKDSANFAYQAFDLPTDGGIAYGDNNPSCLIFGARDGDIEKFEFNPKNQKLTIIYLTDDNTPIKRGENEKQKRIVRNLVFNGTKFIADTFH